MGKLVSAKIFTCMYIYLYIWIVCNCMYVIVIITEEQVNKEERVGKVMEGVGSIALLPSGSLSGHFVHLPNSVCYGLHGTGTCLIVFVDVMLFYLLVFVDTIGYVVWFCFVSARLWN